MGLEDPVGGEVPHPEGPRRILGKRRFRGKTHQFAARDLRAEPSGLRLHGREDRGETGAPGPTGLKTPLGGLNFVRPNRPRPLRLRYISRLSKPLLGQANLLVARSCLPGE